MGKSEHIHAKSNLMLKTRCFANLSSPHAALFPFSTLFEKLETLVSSGALVTGSYKLQISARFVMDDLRISDLDTKAFIQGLATVFCGAEVWVIPRTQMCHANPLGGRCGNSLVLEHARSSHQAIRISHATSKICFSRCDILHQA